MQTLTADHGTGLALTSAEVSRMHERVLTMTCTLFPAASPIFSDMDRETGAAFFVVPVKATGSLESIVSRNDDWHRQMLQLVGDGLPQYRLLIDAE
jgi:hypothetical protein